MISGKQEGIFQWLAINYALGCWVSVFLHLLGIILGMLNHSGDHSSLSNAKTVGIMDMGGASVQIAFEIQNRYQLKKPEVKFIGFFTLCWQISLFFRWWLLISDVLTTLLSIFTKFMWTHFLVLVPMKNWSIIEFS